MLCFFFCKWWYKKTTARKYFRINPAKTDHKHRTKRCISLYAKQKLHLEWQLWLHNERIKRKIFCERSEGATQIFCTRDVQNESILVCFVQHTHTINFGNTRIHHCGWNHKVNNPPCRHRWNVVE